MDPSPDNNVFDVKAEESPDQTMTASSRKSPLKIVLIFLLIIAILVAFTATAFVSYRLGQASLKAKANRLNQLSNPNSPMFANLNGNIEGKITNVSGNTIAIESVRGGKGVFNLASPLSMSEIKDGKLVEIGTTPGNIRLNENAILRVVVRGFNDGYDIDSIIYNKSVPPSLIPDMTKLASPSAKVSTKK